MRRLLALVCLLAPLVVGAAQHTITSPDGTLTLTVSLREGQLFYTVQCDNQTVVEPSRLGLRSNNGDYSDHLSLNNWQEGRIDKQYTLSRAKVSASHYVANQLLVELKNAKGRLFSVEFRLDNHNLALRYLLPKDGEEASIRMLEELTAQYATENTVEAGFVEDVAMEYVYVADELITIEELKTVLTANTTGETTYTVVSGDTYSEIAQDNEMSLDELMELNPQASLKSLFVGDVLTVKRFIPYLPIITVESVSYDASLESPVEYLDDDTMYEGNFKVITQGTNGMARVNANVTYLNGYETERTIVSSETLTEPTVTYMARGTAPRPKTASNGYYIWPCQGWISSRFGWRNIFGGSSFHGGLDIANNYGTTIVAADGGLVTYSGWNNGGYGYLVVITHDDGSQTYYGHNSSLLVNKGERVWQGQAIAKMGSTGRSTGNHCHFEIRINGERVNPENYL